MKDRDPTHWIGQCDHCGQSLKLDAASEAELVAQAKRRGWIIDTHRGEIICPDHIAVADAA